MTLREAITRLSEAGVSSPEYDARLIYRELGGIHDILLFNRDAESDRPEVISAVERRATGEPLQYILGSVGFYREEYKVSPACLIPREDTEVLVDYAVKNLPEGGRFIDLCTGSGCIAISTLKNTRGTTAVAVDVSRPALRIAKENAALSGLADAPIRYIVDDCKKFVERELRRGNRYDAIIMDPPSYGRGPSGEVWKIEDCVDELVSLSAKLLSDDPLFFLINSYTTGLSPMAMQYILGLKVASVHGGHMEAGELGLPVTASGLAVPCGASARWYK